MVPFRRTLLGVLLGLMLGHAALPLEATRRQELTPEQEYLALVESYRSGQAEAALTRLLTGKPDQWLPVVERLVKRGSTFVGGGLVSTDAFYRAAALMHAQAAFLLWTHSDDKAASAHFDVARALVDLSDRFRTTSPTFRPRWYLATALRITRLVSAEQAAACFAEATARVPGDVPLLTAAGWFSAHRADLPAAPAWSLRTAQTRRRQYQEIALRYLTSAVAADPQAPEAALRLAHLEMAMGRTQPAAARLAVLLARDDLDRSLAYVGHLVLGRIHENEHRVTEAEQEYREAMTLDPVAQSARVALAQLLHATGNPDEAADIVQAMLSAGEARTGNDPWSDYRLAYPLIGQLIFDELIAEVRQ